MEEEDDGLFDTDFWGTMFLISVCIFAGATLLGWAGNGYSLIEAATWGLWIGPGFMLLLFFLGIAYRAFRYARAVLERLR